MKTRQPVWNDLLYKKGKTNNGSLFEKTLSLLEQKISLRENGLFEHELQTAVIFITMRSNEI